MSPIPAHCPYKAGDRVQMHGYPGGMPGHGQTGFRGVVEGYLGGTILTGTTDDGQRWAEHWGGLDPDGTPNKSAASCTCHAPAGQGTCAVCGRLRPVAHGLMTAHRNLGMDPCTGEGQPPMGGPR